MHEHRVIVEALWSPDGESCSLAMYRLVQSAWSQYA
jgi:DNA-binding GntR family transcriptional regulator